MNRRSLNSTRWLMFFAAGLLTVSGLPLRAQTQPDSDQAQTSNDSSIPDASLLDDHWGAEFGAVPNLLRLHLPMLQRRGGLVVRDVQPGRPADLAGFRNGDILLQVNGQPVLQQDRLGRPDEMMMALVIRRGSIQMLSPGNGPAFGIPSPPNRSFGNLPSRPGRGWHRDPGLGTTAASSSSSSSEAVSISQSGDQISLSIDSSDPKIGRLQMQGTRKQIQQQLDSDRYSKEAKQMIRQAIGF
ncbi:hypothetical protein K227x_63670 [Rubripirellula lacrimiformis]|uniref:PDZ domain-containing protein n=1 Tax=Rubripirellula lacrimiformis TaxID=1930273 RepID=A0A517NLC7_9BACT|nr:PDZ domain-containing protein [Rubripirellula lacrimiformis]QDT07938.1 hypothetical protein K227x_63670 [Rubripirellula lacrimiformis]